MMVAQSLDPVSSIVARDLAVIHFYRRDFETALEQCDHTIELNPHFAPAYWMLGVIQEQRKDFDESAAAFQRAVHLSPQTPRMHGALGRTFALSGKRKLALEVLHKLEAYAQRALRLAAGVRVDPVRAGRQRPGVQVAREGRRRSPVRYDLASRSIRASIRFATTAVSQPSPNSCTSNSRTRASVAPVALESQQKQKEIDEVEVTHHPPDRPRRLACLADCRSLIRRRLIVRDVIHNRLDRAQVRVDCFQILVSRVPVGRPRHRRIDRS